MCSRILSVVVNGLILAVCVPNEAAGQSAVSLTDVVCTVTTPDMCHLDVTLSGVLSADSEVYVGFYDGGLGWSGTPVPISPGLFQVNLSYECFEPPNWWGTMDTWYHPEYVTFLEFYIAICADSLNWWVENANSAVHLFAPVTTFDDGPLQWTASLSTEGGSQQILGSCGPGTIWDDLTGQCIPTSPDGSPLCGPGTFWHPVNHRCEVSLPSDVDFDGCIAINDLLTLLANFTTCWEPGFGPGDLDGDGVPDAVDPCVGQEDECGVCNGEGIPAGACDCAGNLPDALGECFGNCEADLDGDGVCDDVDDCIGSYDLCGVCNGEGPRQFVVDSVIILYDSVYVEPAETWFVYESGRDTTYITDCRTEGCMDSLAINFNLLAEVDPGLCAYPCQVEEVYPGDFSSNEAYFSLGTDSAQTNVFFETEILLEVPWSSGDLDSVSSVSVDTIYFDGLNLDELGFSITWLNNQTLQTPFQVVPDGAITDWSPNEPLCAVLFGVPTMMGDYDLTVEVSWVGNCDGSICFGDSTLTVPLLISNSPCAGEDHVSYHGYDYDIVEIGDQCWFAENLRTEQFNNGDGLTRTYSQYYFGCTPPILWWSWEYPGVTYPDASFSYNEPTWIPPLSGLMYSDSSIRDARNVCPSGWRVPQHEDWNSLILRYDSEAVDISSVDSPFGIIFEISDSAGGALKQSGTSETGASNWPEPNAGATNESGFSAVATGMQQYSSWIAPGNTTFWSVSSDEERQILLGGGIESILLYESGSIVGYSNIRCVRD